MCDLRGTFHFKVPHLLLMARACISPTDQIQNKYGSDSGSEGKDCPVSAHTQVTRNFFGESTSYSSFDPAKELGVQDPIGFWDPLGLSADKDEATFKRRRAVEIKHGRIVSFPSFFPNHLIC